MDVRIFCLVSLFSLAGCSGDDGGGGTTMGTSVSGTAPTTSSGGTGTTATASASDSTGGTDSGGSSTGSTGTGAETSGSGGSGGSTTAGTGGSDAVMEFCTVACNDCFNMNAPWKSMPADQCIPECVADFDDCDASDLPTILQCTGGAGCPAGAFEFGTCVAPFTCLL